MQLEFLFADEDSLKRDLEVRTGIPIDLTITNNTSSIMTFRHKDPGKPATLRIHRMFLGANPQVVEALATWLVKPRSAAAGKVIDGFIENHTFYLGEKRPRTIQRKTRGLYHNLEELFDEVNVEMFETTVDAGITWGRIPAATKRRSIRLGSYTEEDHLIRIHPYLDQDFVPRYFVRYIVFHEMLHAHVGIETTPSGRRRIHSPRFNRLERKYPDFARATAWHDNPRNLERLLRPMRKAS